VCQIMRIFFYKNIKLSLSYMLAFLASFMPISQSFLIRKSAKKKTKHILKVALEIMPIFGSISKSKSQGKE
jgi:hypothetical protein